MCTSHVENPNQLHFGFQRSDSTSQIASSFNRSNDNYLQVQAVDKSAYYDTGVQDGSSIHPHSPLQRVSESLCYDDMARGDPTSYGNCLNRPPFTRNEGRHSAWQGRSKSTNDNFHMHGILKNDQSHTLPSSQGNQLLKSKLTISYHELPTHRSSKDANTFDGKSSDWKDYIIHFEFVASWNGWNDYEKLQQLVMSLRGQAQKILTELSVEQFKSYEEVRDFIGRRFNPVERETAYRCQFHNRKQQRQESASDFGYSLQRLCLQAFQNINPEAREIYLIDQFIYGLARPELRSHVQFRHPTSIDAAIALAIEYEAFEASHGILRKPHFEPEGQINSVKTSKSTQSQERSSWADSITLHDIAKLLQDLMLTIKSGNSNSSCSRSNSADRRSKLQNAEYYHCHKKGHIASNCPAKQEN